MGIGESTIFSGDREFLDLFSADGQFIGFDLHEDVQDDRPPEYEMPEDVQPLDIDRMAHRPGVQYLVSRGFAYEELPELVALYDLHYAYSGDYSGRVVVPVYMHNKLVGVTGRAVFKASLRYKNSRKEEGPVNIYESLANFDSILEEDVPEALVVVEGPFDMIKVDFYGRKYGIRSTCLFTKHIGKQQEDFLYELISYSKKTIILLDDDAFAESLLYAGRLSHFGDRVSSLGFDPNKFQAEDAGALSPRGVAKLCREILGKLH